MHSEQAFRDTSSWETSRSLDNLPKFLEYHTYGDKSKLSASAEVPGSPHTILITLAGLRAADIARYVSSLPAFPHQI